MQLSPEQKATLATELLPTYPCGLEEDQILQHPLTYLLTYLYQEELPREAPPTPSEIVAWVGYAATNRLDSTPPEYVWSKVGNQTKKAGRRRRTEGGYAAGLEGRTSVLSRLEALADFEQLTPIEQQWMREAAEATSRATLAKTWGLTLGGTKDRLERLRKKIKILQK